VGIEKQLVKNGYILLVLLVTSCTAPGDNIGTLEDSSRDRSIPYQIWLPNVEVDTVKFPLVILSHGSGGEYSNHTWLIDSLVENGFIVAALNHPMNTTRDNTDEGVISVWHRPRDISVLLDYLLNDSNWVNVIDENRIGAAGFSSGGYTVLALAGAIYDPELMSAYCASQERGKDCELATDFSNVDFRDSSASYKDERIKSVFSMAPAVGSAITKESLAEIELPVFIIASKDDELVSPNYGAIRYAENIPLSDLVLLPSGGHFIFLECNAITTVVDWFNSELDLCGTQFNVDRDGIRKMVSAKAVSFFNDNLLAVTP
jgi:predicted dienelactone hydrolase